MLDELSARILEVTRELVRIPSQGGIDDPSPICKALMARLAEAGLSGRILMSGSRPVGVVAEIEGAHPGPAYALNAVVDTAPVGNVQRWSAAPFSADLRGNRLIGRGTGDSKVAASVFIEVGRALVSKRDAMHGRAVLFFDASEHQGDFAGMRSFLEAYGSGDKRVQGMIIGYPGNESLQIGSRGFHRSRWTMSIPERADCGLVASALRASFQVPLPEGRSVDFPLSTKVTPTAVTSTATRAIDEPGVVFDIDVSGKAAHSGASGDNGINALLKTADFVDELLGQARLRYGPGVQPRVLSLNGGKDFSVVPDKVRLRVFVPTAVCDERAAANVVRVALESVDDARPAGSASRVVSSSRADASERAVDTLTVNVDVRTTPSCDGDTVDHHAGKCAELIERSGIGCAREHVATWPAFRLPDESPLAAAMQRAIDVHGPKGVMKRISGPSNAGNVAAAYGIPATAGFGASCRHAHGTDESIDITTIPAALAVHIAAMETLLGMR